MALITVQMDINNWYSSTSARTVDTHLKTMDVFCAKKLNLIGTRMHSSRMRTARSSSRDGGRSPHPPEQAPPPPDPPQLPPWVWAWKPARHAGIPPPWRPAARHAGIPPAMHAGIAPPPTHPPPPCGQNS